MTRILLAGILFAGSASMAAAHGPSEHSSAAKQPAVSAKAAETGAALRDLWTGHIFWVRNVAFATLTKNDAAANAAEQQVVENAKAIAGAIEPFYGAAAKDALFKLLAGHYGAIKEYLIATSAADSSAQGKAIQTLTKNAEDIAIFLSKANPHLPKDAVTGLLQAHGGHHVQEIDELKAGKYEAEARTWEDMKAHMYVVSDALAQAIVKQFPSKF
jgi:hypothetical protein